MRSESEEETREEEKEEKEEKKEKIVKNWSWMENPSFLDDNSLSWNDGWNYQEAARKSSGQQAAS